MDQLEHTGNVATIHLPQGKAKTPVCSGVEYFRHDGTEQHDPKDDSAPATLRSDLPTNQPPPPPLAQSPQKVPSAHYSNPLAISPHPDTSIKDK